MIAGYTPGRTATISTTVYPALADRQRRRCSPVGAGERRHLRRVSAGGESAGGPPEADREGRRTVMALSVDIRKQLGDFHLEVQFDAGDETLALLGASGCGKSVTLKCVAGILTAGRGADHAGWRDPLRQRRQDRPAAPAAARGVSVPGLRPVSQHDGAAEHRRRCEGPGPPAGDGGGADPPVPAGGRGRPEAPAALRRPEAAGGPGPDPGIGAEGRSAGRALLPPWTAI